MAEVGDNAPIIIKRVKKVSHGGHHGGAWKVAYADFVTAMMAFFLLLWLLNATTDEQKQGIADYFTPISIAKSTSGGGGVLGGQTLSSEGVMRADRSSVSLTIALPRDLNEEEGEDLESKQDPSQITIDEEQLEELRAQQEAAQFAATEDALKQAIESVPELKELAENLIIDQTPEGLRIQIVDQEKLSMFPSGSAKMFEHTRKLLGLVADAVSKLPQRIAIKGHTDATPFRSDTGYSNWELSTDRANASRRALIAAGLPADRVESVAGRADQEPMFPEDPTSPRNRRISIILLREKRDAPAAVTSDATGDTMPAVESSDPAVKNQVPGIEDPDPGVESPAQGTDSVEKVEPSG